MDTGSPEALRELVRVWEGLDNNKLSERSGLKAANAVVRRLASPRPAGNFSGAREAREVLNNVIPPLPAEMRDELLRKLLDGSLSEDWGPVTSEVAQVDPEHPSAEGGATRTILEAAPKSAGGNPSGRKRVESGQKNSNIFETSSR